MGMDGAITMQGREARPVVEEGPGVVRAVAVPHTGLHGMRVPGLEVRPGDEDKITSTNIEFHVSALRSGWTGSNLVALVKPGYLKYPPIVVHGHPVTVPFPHARFSH